MIIPVRCVTCGKVIADKWEAYEERCREVEAALRKGGGKSSVNAAASSLPGRQQQAPATTSSSGAVVVIDSYKGAILDELGLTRICCRRHMLTHVDLIDVI